MQLNALKMADFFFLHLDCFLTFSRVNSHALSVAEEIPGFRLSSEKSGFCLNWLLD